MSDVTPIERIIAQMRNERIRYKSHDWDSVSASIVDEWADELEAALAASKPSPETPTKCQWVDHADNSRVLSRTEMEAIAKKYSPGYLPSRYELVEIAETPTVPSPSRPDAVSGRGRGGNGFECFVQRTVTAPEVVPSPSRLESIALEFVAYYKRGRGCSNCGGIPHTTTCFVGRFEEAIVSAAPQEPTPVRDQE